MRSFSKIALVSYLMILLWLVLFKFSVSLSSLSDQARSLNLTPFANYSRDNIKELIYNFAVFVPFGLFLSVNFKRASFLQKLAVVFGFSLGVEIIQYVFAIGIADITDLISNTTGGLLGLLLYDLSNRHVSDKKLDDYLVIGGTLFLSVCILIIGILLVSGVRFQSSPPNSLPLNGARLNKIQIR